VQSESSDIYESTSWQVDSLEALTSFSIFTVKAWVTVHYLFFSEPESNDDRVQWPDVIDQCF